MDSNYLQLINQTIARGREAKSLAISSEANVDEYSTAADYYNEAINILAKWVDENKAANINYIAQAKTLINYYLYEANECKSTFNYKNGNYDEAIEFAQIAQKHIQASLKTISYYIDKVNNEIKVFLQNRIHEFTLCNYNVPLRMLEPKARKAMKEQDYVLAMDVYTEMSALQDKVYQYVNSSSLDQVYKRTERGNYVASKASIAMSIVGVYIIKENNKDYHKEILEQLLIALKNIKEALVINPQQEKYKQGVDTITNHLKNLLNENKQHWLQYLTEFDKETNLIPIMKQTDIELYKLQQAKLEIEQNKLKILLLTFGFYTGLFIGLGYFLWQIALSEISWFRLLVVIIALPIFFVIIGAFALKSTDSLKEENFMKLIELALKTNLKGIKFLSKAGSSEETES